MYNILIGGAAGQGIDTTVSLLEKVLKRSGYFVYSTRDVMSRVRGGHNFSLIRFGVEEITSHSSFLDGIIALNEETIGYHKDSLKPKGFLLFDGSRKIKGNEICIPMTQAAKELGNLKVVGSIAAGAVLKLFGISLTIAEEALDSLVKKDYLDINRKAVRSGYESVEQKYPYHAGAFKDYMLLSGNKALALGAMAGGLKFYSAYPMSPSTSIMEYLAQKSLEAGIAVEQAEDEIAAINMAIGASYAGVRSMTGTSGGGFSLMVEALGLSGMAEIPVVVANIQRPGPATGLPTRTEQSDLKFVISASHGEFPRMVIALRDHTDAFYQTARAFYLAEKYQIPVILLSDQYLADSVSTVRQFDPSRNPNTNVAEQADLNGDYLRYRITPDGISPRLIPGKGNYFVSADSDEHDEYGYITEAAEVRNAMMEKRLRKQNKLEKELLEPEFIGHMDCDVLLLAWGSTFGPVREAIRILNKTEGDRYGALVFGDICPLPTKLLKKMAVKAGTIINVEQNATGQLAGYIREITGITCNKSILKYDGRQISGEEIVSRLKEGGSL